MDEYLRGGPARAPSGGNAPGGLPMERAPAKIGKEQLQRWNRLLTDYKTKKADVDSRVKAAEEWWKIRNTRQEYRDGKLTAGGPGDFHSKSGWLHNVIVSKHADAMDAFPEPNILPREPSDKVEAKRLSDIIPVVLEQNEFETTYSDVQWQRLKTGTGAYKITWDAGKLNGLGDISVRRVNLLDLFWEPGVENIQDSRCVFHTATQEIEDLEEQYPQLKGRIRSGGFTAQKFIDQKDPESPQATVIEVYYRKRQGTRKVLHYCKYVGETVLFATENDPEMQERGLYDHGKYPFVLDRLFPVEGSPCGYGFVDLCHNPQSEIDILKTAMIKNAVVGATPRYFLREDGEVNEEEFSDLSRPIVHVDGNMAADSLRVIDHPGLDGNHISLLNATIQELRETSGNTETATGSSTQGATAASAIAALQEASGKGSRDATQASYRCYAEIVGLIIELIRQFYDLPRQFRILGARGAEEFVSYSNAGLQPQAQEIGGYRLPVFDIKVVPQRRSAYTRLSQNELALQFYGLGFFDPARADQVMAALDMMEFDGKDALEQRVQQNGDMYQQLLQWQSMAIELAKKFRPDLLKGLSGAITGAPAGGGGGAPVSGSAAAMPQPMEEPSHVKRARTQAQAAPVPGGA